MNKPTDQEIAVAKSINGPWFEMDKNSRYSLNEIRSAKWINTPSQERAALLMQARAAIAQASTTELTGEGEILATGLKHGA